MNGPCNRKVLECGGCDTAFGPPDGIENAIKPCKSNAVRKRCHAGLAQVSEMAASGESFNLCLKNFLDGFYFKPTVEALQPEPPRLADKNPRFGEIEDAYLAATAEWLAWKYDLRPPSWIFDPNRALRRPWFASSLSALRAVLLIESPAPFRSRNLFVSENALTRA